MIIKLAIHPQMQSDEMSGNPDFEESSGIAVEDEVKKPKMYRVLMHNDDYTTMEYVILVLKKFFSKNQSEAEQIMLKIHNSGIGLCGIYTFEIAEAKTIQVSKHARGNGQPLRVTFEPED